MSDRVRRLIGTACLGGWIALLLDSLEIPAWKAVALAVLFFVGMGCLVLPQSK
jgi:hypothetical protein